MVFNCVGGHSFSVLFVSFRVRLCLLLACAVFLGSFNGESRQYGSEFDGFFCGISPLDGVSPYLVFFCGGAFSFYFFFELSKCHFVFFGSVFLCLQRGLVL